MKVYTIIGSANTDGATAAAVRKLEDELSKKHSDVQFKTVYADKLDIACCTGCCFCRQNEGCSQQDDAQTVIDDISSSDEIIIATPIYFGNMSGQLKVLCDRLYPAYRGKGVSIFKGKKLHLVYTQHSACSAYADFRATARDYLFGFLGFDIVDTTVVGYDGSVTE